jgi:broad specificity phosphatase PhoE
VSGLLLLRHAQSVWNAEARWQGWADPPLSREGEQQARLAGCRLAGERPFDLVVASDLIRASRTAELLAEALTPSPPVRVEPGLREYNVGDWTGLTREEIEARWPGALAGFSTGQLTAPPGGEERGVFEGRVLMAGRRIGAAAAVSGLERLLVVVHAGVVRALARAVDTAEYHVGHLAGYRGTYAEGGLFPTERVNLLGPEGEAGVGETAIAPAV